MNAPQVQPQPGITLDVSRDIAQLGELIEFSKSAIAQDVHVKRDLTMAAAHMARLIGEKACKQHQVVSSSLVPGALAPERLGGQ